MIRSFKKSDTDQVLNIWLESSVKAHDFMEKGYWGSKLDDMRRIYLPSSQTYVFEENGTIRGFVSLSGDTLAALFVSPAYQGKRIGTALMAKAKDMRSKLLLTVYKENAKTVEFYNKCGFKPVKEQTDRHTGHKEILMEFNR